MEKTNAPGDFSHVIVAVKDLEKAQKFFTGLLGAKFGEVGQLQQLGMKVAMSDRGIELISPTREDSDVARFISKKGEGVYAVVYRTADAGQAKVNAERMGVRVTADVSQADLFGREATQRDMREIWLHPKDTFGVCMLFVQSGSK